MHEVEVKGVIDKIVPMIAVSKATASKRPRRLSDRFCTCIIRKADVYYPLRLFRATCRALKITMTVEIACRFAAIRKVTSPE